MFSSVKPVKFTCEIEEILQHFSTEINSPLAKQHFSRFHKNNAFNKRFSGVLDVFADIKSVTERLTDNIQASIKAERQIQKNEEVGQEQHYEADSLTSQNKTDLRTLYVNSKIFLDDYTGLLRFIFNWREIGDRSITGFYNDLEKYDGQDKDILAFKESCLENLKEINIYITEYRNNKVVHNQKKHKQDTEWFLNNMNGEIRFMGGGRPSITPQEVLFIVVEYVAVSSNFCIELLSSQLSSGVKE